MAPECSGVLESHNCCNCCGSRVLWIKSEHHWLQEPGHVIHQLKLWGLQDAEVQYYTMDTVQRGSWYAHSECLLQTLLSSGKEEDRRFALSTIMKIRKKAKEAEK